jgi:hypothetical protein
VGALAAQASRDIMRARTIAALPHLNKDFVTFKHLHLMPARAALQMEEKIFISTVNIQVSAVLAR